MKYIKLHSTIIGLLLWSFCFSQQFTNYTTKDGLPSNLVYKIAQDKEGFLWFATDKGLVKYNGNTMKTFTTKDSLATNDIWGIYPAPDGKIWYVAKASKLGYIEHDTIFSFESDLKGEIFNPLFSSLVGNDFSLSSSTKFHSLKGDKWQRVNKALEEDKIIITPLLHPNVSGFQTTENLDSIEVLGHSNQVLKRFPFTKVLNNMGVRGQIADSLFYWATDSHYTFFNLNTLKIQKRNLKDEIGIDKSKFVRINVVNDQLQITGKGFVSVLNKELHATNTYYIPEDINAHFGFYDKSGSIWLTTFTDGIYYLPKEKQDIIYGLENQKITGVNYIDNKIIVDVFNKGFYQYNNSNKSFVPYLLNNEHVFSAAYIKELTTEYYLSKTKISAFKNNKFSVTDYANTISKVNEIARQLVYYDKHLYGNNSIGINKLNTNSFSLEKHYYQPGINQLLVYNSKFLLATSNGLLEFKNEKFRSIDFKNQDFNKPTLNITILTDTEILINTDGFGTYISDLERINLLPNSEFLIVNSAIVDGSSVYLATESGVYKYQIENGNYCFIKQLTTSDGLPSNNVNSVLKSGNKLIVGTNRGVAVIPEDLKKTSQLLNVYFESVTYNQQSISSVNSVFNYENNNDVNIVISTLDYSVDDSDLLYNYKLEPIQKAWNTSHSNEINFNDLQPGVYTFSVSLDTIEREVRFTIKPLWWQTLWFKIFAVIASVIVVYLISRYISKRAAFKKHQKLFEDKRLSELQLKALRSQMNPHFVFNSLSAIQYFINSNDYETSEHYLVKFSKLIRQFFELSKENDITIKDEITLLKNYLEIEKLRFREKLSFDFDIDEQLNLETSKMPTMLLQPIVENAINHGIFNKEENGLVLIRFVKDEDKIKIEIIDDGVGFAKTMQRSKNKIKSSHVLKDRLYFLNQSGKWQIEYNEEEAFSDKEDKGNKATFIIQEIK
ncbi:histidine kinase [Winogradskyella eckloniae]|uniref:sensor histidine kinase n=1 Tax=Winogradskyella eckloniae TaxID=1089306 RepID=UPI001566800C|nr:histidine kinase [Winogradskyella eckloniae]NRD21384.1 histidine kinase [Winogradskyella eckloniae]